MALSTAEAIRDRIYTLIESLTPTTDATKFRRYRNEWGTDFIAAAEFKPDAMLRRFQVREVSDDEPPITTGVIEERVTVRYQVLIAYPQSHRYGRDNAVDRDDVMNEDWKAINFKVGIYGRGNFSTTTNGSYDATPLGAVRDMERGDGVDLLVIDVPFEFYRATGVEVASEEVTVSQDTTSLKYVPASAAEWTQHLSDAAISAGNPSHTWLCQESSGNLADSIGSATLSAAGSPGYQSAVTGWTRKAVTIANGSTTDRFAAGSGVGPDVSAESALWLFYISLPTNPSTTSHLGGAASYPTGRSLSVANNGRLISYVRNAAVLSSQNYTGLGVFPIALQYNRTAGTAVTFTHLEKITNSYNSGAVDGLKGIGSLAGGASPSAAVVYMAAFEGAAAELSAAEIKTLLQSLGWTVSWS